MPLVNNIFRLATACNIAIPELLASLQQNREANVQTQLLYHKKECTSSYLNDAQYVSWMVWFSDTNGQRDKGYNFL